MFDYFTYWHVTVALGVSLTGLSRQLIVIGLISKHITIFMDTALVVQVKELTSILMFTPKVYISEP